MPGNLEAPRILPNTRTEVKKKSTENPYRTTIFGPAGLAGTTATKPGSRAPKAAKRTLDAGAPKRPTQLTIDSGPGPAGALHAT